MTLDQELQGRANWWRCVLWKLGWRWVIVEHFAAEPPYLPSALMAFHSPWRRRLDARRSRELHRRAGLDA